MNTDYRDILILFTIAKEVTYIFKIYVNLCKSVSYYQRSTLL
jgi:hypothetical protein